VGVFDLHQPERSRAGLSVRGRFDHCFRTQPAAVPVAQEKSAPEHLRYRPGLNLHNVAVPIEKDRVPEACVHGDRDLVPHATTRDEKRRLLPEKRRRFLLEEANRWVLAEHVIAHLRLRHGAAHGGGRAGDRVAPQIDVSRCQIVPDSLNREVCGDSLSLSGFAETFPS